MKIAAKESGLKCSPTYPWLLAMLVFMKLTFQRQLLMKVGTPSFMNDGRAQFKQDLSKLIGYTCIFKNKAL